MYGKRVSRMRLNMGTKDGRTINDIDERRSYQSSPTAKEARLTTKSRSSTNVVDVFGHTTCIDDRINSRDSKGSTLAHDKEIISCKGGTESSELGDSDKEVVEQHLRGYSWG